MAHMMTIIGKGHTQTPFPDTESYFSTDDR
jgi:hypothetical protein